MIKKSIPFLFAFLNLTNAFAAPQTPNDFFFKKLGQHIEENKNQTLGEAVDQSLFLSAAEKEDFKNFLKEQKLDNWNYKPAKIHFSGHTLTMDGATAEVVNAETLKFNGSVMVTYNPKMSIEKNMEAMILKIKNQMGSKSSMLFPGFFVQPAYANVDSISALGTAALMVFRIGPALGVYGLGGVALSATAVAAVGAAAFYLGKEAYETFRKGEVSCTADGKFRARAKTRNKAYLASSEDVTIEDQSVEALMGAGSVPCTPAKASELQKKFRENEAVMEKAIKDSKSAKPPQGSIPGAK